MLDYLSIDVFSKDDVNLHTPRDNSILRRNLFDDTGKSLQFLNQLLEELKHETASLFVNIYVEISNYEYSCLSESPKTPALNTKNPNALLSKREKEILRLVFNGLTNKQIAEKLFISFETVKSHRKNILSKTESKNTASLISKIDISTLL